jgi:hypothetical protein
MMVGRETEHTELACGLLQGSPASTVLYLLYTAPLHEPDSDSNMSCSGYVDDCGILVLWNDLEQTTLDAREAPARTIAWGHPNGHNFSLAKNVVMHFSHEKYRHAPVIIHDGHDKVAPKLLRQLGMHLDKGLTFKPQIEMGMSNHRSMANDLERTLQDRFGAPLKVVQKAIRSVIVQE